MYTRLKNIKSVMRCRGSRSRKRSGWALSSSSCSVFMLSNCPF